MPHQHRAGVLLRCKDDILLVLSPEGKWSIPKGSVKANETFKDCARREFQEETGLFIDLEHARLINVPNCKVFLLHVDEPLAIDMSKVTTKHEVAEVAWRNIFDTDIYMNGNSGLKKYIDTVRRSIENENTRRMVRRQRRFSIHTADDIVRALDDIRAKLFEVEGYIRSHEEEM